MLSVVPDCIVDSQVMTKKNSLLVQRVRAATDGNEPGRSISTPALTRQSSAGMCRWPASMVSRAAETPLGAESVASPVPGRATAGSPAMTRRGVLRVQSAGNRRHRSTP